MIAPHEVRVEEIAQPHREPNQLLLQVRLVGMCGSDLNTFRGKNPLVSYPRILGHEIAATVIEAPPSGSKVPVGANVTVSPYTSCGRCASCLNGRPNACRFNETLGVQRDGALTEFISVPEEKLYVAGKLSLKELALVEPLTVGFHAVARCRVTAKDRVLVLGAGGVGLGAIAGAARRGAKVIAADLDDKKLALAKAAGASYAVNSASEPLSDRLRDLTDGLGPEVVIEAIGLPATFRSAVEEVAFTGRVVYIGYAKELVSYETRLFVQKELDIMGSRNALPEDFKAVIEMLEAGAFPVESTISRIAPLAEGAAALNEWSSQPSAFSKILVQVSE